MCATMFFELKPWENRTANHIPYEWFPSGCLFFIFFILALTCVFEIFICKMQYVDTHAQIYTDTHTVTLGTRMKVSSEKRWLIDRTKYEYAQSESGRESESNRKKINEANTLTEPNSWNVFVLDCDENQLKYWPIERSIEYEFWSWWMVHCIVMCTTTTAAIHIEKCPRSCHIWNVLKLTVIWTLRQHRKR